MVIHPQDRS